MANIPVIIGFGGVNACGRTSGHHGYRRQVIDSLAPSDAAETYAALASMMGLVVAKGDALVDATSGDCLSYQQIAERYGQWIKDNTLIRQLEDNLFDREQIPVHREATVGAAGQTIQFVIKKTQLLSSPPANWRIEELPGGNVRVNVEGEVGVLLPDLRRSLVQAAGQLPSGFKPDELYNSRNHPRGLQLAVYGASDALHSLGIDWEVIRSTLAPDEVGVYAGSAMGQLDFNGAGGMLQSNFLAKRVSAKQCALSLAEMPADFINAYVIGGMGSAGGVIGACATFLYNVRLGVRDIQSGRRRLVIVGSAEAPITPEVMEGYRTMGALAEDEALHALDPGREAPDYRRAARPFSDNCGFTLAEGAQFLVLCDDALALELGANIHGAVADVFVNADGFKKSIPGPGVGNYVTMAKAAAVTRAIIGEEGLRTRTYVHAHGTSTPQNRVTESEIINEIAKTFGIEKWPVAAIKSYIGHTLGPAGGDQIVSGLGVWKYGIIPGIKTVERIADDVAQSNISFMLQDTHVGVEGMDAMIINSKGFGGNNASASILAPHVVKAMLTRKYGEAAMADYVERNAPVEAKAAQNDSDITSGKLAPIYLFDNGVLDGGDLELSDRAIGVKGYSHSIDLTLANPYE